MVTPDQTSLASIESGFSCCTQSVDDDSVSRETVEETIQVEEVVKEINEGKFETMSGDLEDKEINQRFSEESVLEVDWCESGEETEDMNDEREKKTLDTAAFSAFLKAAFSGSLNGDNLTTTSQDLMKLLSMEHLAGLDSSSSLVSSPSFQSGEIESNLSEEEKHKLEKLQSLLVKYLRLVHRLGVSVEDSVVAQVLYNSAFHTGKLSGFDAAKKMAMEFEAEGKEDLNFSLNILVIGKSGVGKSATINSILGNQKASINAFQPSTTSIQVVSGTVGGVKLTFIDTPGLKSAAMDQSTNAKMLSSVKKVMKKYPPDVVLYVDRLNAQYKGFNDMPLLRTITASLGSSILKHAILVLTHAGSAPPDGPSGTSLSYNAFVSQCVHIVQHSIGQAVGDLRLINPGLMNPVSLVENHPLCRKNREGEKVLPNGQSWRLQLLLSCYSRKIISDANSLLKPQKPMDYRKVFGFPIRSLSLPNLLSWLFQSRTHPKLPTDEDGDSIDSDIEIDDVSDSEQEDDEYDELPPFKPLRKTQLAKLSKEQKKAYYDEYDYRVKLLQKKQWRKELRMMKEMKKNEKKNTESEAEPSSPPVLLPDMILPYSFDSDHPTYRYRSPEPTSFVTRTVLDTRSWDHDYGFDRVTAERSLAIAKRFPVAVSVEVTKDKNEFNGHIDSAICAKHGDKGSTMAMLHIQKTEQLMYLLEGETKFQNLKGNKMTLGGLVTFLGGVIVTGFKLENQIAIGKRLILLGNAGTTHSQGDSAYEANIEIRIRETNIPIDQNQYNLGLSVTKSEDDDLTFTANLQTQVSIGRQTKVAAFASLDTKKTGRFTIRTSSSDQLQVAVMTILSLALSIYKMIVRSEDN